MKTNDNTQEFQDQVAVVTGGTSGIGRVTALALAKAGAKVVIAGRRESEGRQVVAEIKAAGGEAIFQRTDVTDEAQVAALVDRTLATYGRIDIAINNAGYEGDMAPISHQTADNYRRTFDVNVLGTLLSLKHEIPAMLKNGGGSIVNISSIAGLVGTPGASVYSASKHAVLGLTKSAALEVARNGIRVNAVSPAATETEMLDRFVGNNAEQKAAFGALHPVGRFGRPNEMSDAILFLASKRSSFVTGQSLTVDGGYTAQ
jgi:NAD(P)-dependent dehydrogenase (short-subunit alcohol dehydrogenase family)